jgi:type I restriction enzyme S subunit
MKTGYKQTEVGVIPEVWEVESMDSLTSLMTNGFVGTATSAYVSSDDGVLYIQGYNVQEGSFNFHGIKRVSRSFHARHQKSCLREGDLLTIQTGDVGVTTIVPPELVGANCHALVISRFTARASDPRFYCHYFNSERGRAKFKEIETGTTMKHLNVGDMKPLLIPAPPLPEQRAIAAALSDVDGLLGALDRLIAKKRDLKQAAMQQLLTGQTRLPGFQGGWEVKRLGDVATLNRLNVIPASWPSQTFVHFSLPAFDEGKSPVVELGSAIGSNKFRVPQGAVLVSKLNPRIPRVWAPLEIPEDSVASTEFLVLIPKDGVSRRFLFILCASARFCEQMELAATGTTGSHQRISPSGALTLKMFVPIDPDEQTAIASVLTEMDGELAVLEQRREKTRALKQGMMQELLTGRTRLV